MKTLASLGYLIVFASLFGMFFSWIHNHVPELIACSALLLTGALLVTGTEIILAHRADTDRLLDELKQNQRK